MAIFERTIKADHRHLTEYIKNHLSDSLSPAPLTVHCIQDFVINDVEIFMIYHSYKDYTPRHFTVISHGGVSNVIICETPLLANRLLKVEDSETLEVFVNRLVANYNPDTENTPPREDKLFTVVSDGDSRKIVTKSFSANHGHLTDYLYNTGKNIAKFQTFKYNERMDYSINGVDFSASFFLYNTDDIPMDFMAVTYNGVNEITYLHRYETDSRKGKIPQVLDSYNPAAPDSENCYYTE